MTRKFVFINGDEEIVLPVTPQSIEVGHGIRIETINIHGLGDVRVAGNRTLANVTINSFFPATNYSFAEAKLAPYEYASVFRAMIAAKKPVRFLVPGTDVNLLVLIDEIRLKEQDGPNDLYYTLSLSEYSPTAAGGGPAPRDESSAPTPPLTHTVTYGDTLWAIARRYLGKGSRYPEIASLNNIPDPNVIRVGQVLAIPQR